MQNVIRNLWVLRSSPLDGVLRSLRSGLSLFPEQQHLDGGPDKSGSGRILRTEDSVDALVCKSVEAKTDGEVFRHGCSFPPQ
jgi:hypothetical protein